MFSRMLARKPRLSFWQWLEQNQTDILQLLKEDPKAGLMRVAKSFALHYKDLSIEMSYDDQCGNCVLSVSPNGDKSKHQRVLDIIASAPTLENFAIVPFKQRKPKALMETARISIGPVTVATEDTFFCAQLHSDKLHLSVYLSGYDGSHFYKAGGFLLLEGFLGEFDLETYIGSIHFTKLEPQHLFFSEPLWKLPVMVDDLKMRLTRKG